MFNSIIIFSAYSAKIGELPTEVVGIINPSSVIATASIIKYLIGPIIP